MGKDEAGRRLAMCLLLAFFPAMLVAILFQQWIRRRLFGPWPIVVAWAAGGLAILLIGRRRPRSSFSAKSMEDLSWRAALGIGAAQCLALWPGVSRSLVTIAGGLAAGLGPRAAVEFSFLLGLLTLGTATVHELFINGGKIVALFGWWRPLAGLLVAAASAWVSMRWMVAYLQRHSFAVFGWYRIGVAALVTALLHGGFLS
jgi:undecaprenyl-diphosphatase